ncbi:Non-specific ribonucleoside hydrolase RihC [termite gut metagenome]|uniref:Non-specific ribonucleoside hydrolase RihC n=1 Tax=termite gut metagenome TaxID=433724 RepID=A0A5J4QPC8_9ZZZZ
MKKYLLTIGFLLVYATAFCQQFSEIDEAVRIKQLMPKEGKVRMILDTDTYNEVDDQFALSYALFSEEKVKVEAIYAAPFYNSLSKSPGDGMEKSYEEIQRLLKLLHIVQDGLVFRGSTNYLKNVSEPIRSEAALDLIQKAKKSTPEDPLYVVAIGCITNVASAILIDPSIINNIVVVWLGGHSLDWPNQREFNLAQDVLAGQVVLNSGVPLVITPCWPVVSHFYTTLPELQYYLKGKNKLCDFLYERVVGYHENNQDVWSKEIWDVVAIAWLINPSWVHTNLVHSPILTDQVTYSVDRSRHFIRMATSINRDAIFRDLFSKLTK